MSGDLKEIYQREGKLHYYFDDKVPCDLFRGQRDSDAKKGVPIIYPNPGFKRGNGQERPPDVMIVERNGTQFVLGCNCIHGEFRGISTFDRKNTSIPSLRWYKLPENTDIPDPIAITQDSAHRDRVNHFTVAPKHDMPLALFLVWLQSMEKYLEEA